MRRHDPHDVFFGLGVEPPLGQISGIVDVVGVGEDQFIEEFSCRGGADSRPVRADVEELSDVLDVDDLAIAARPTGQSDCSLPIAKHDARDIGDAARFEVAG